MSSNVPQCRPMSPYIFFSNGGVRRREWRYFRNVPGMFRRLDVHVRLVFGLQFLVFSFQFSGLVDISLNYSSSDSCDGHSLRLRFARRSSRQESGEPKLALNAGML